MRNHEREAWLHERRAAVVTSYDAEAESYDDNPYPTETQTEWVERLLSSCPPAGRVLDAPCGTGKYFELAAGAGLSVVGVDQSGGMLAQAAARGIAERLVQLPLQALDVGPEFDAVMTVDAMENVPPEDWPQVLANLHRAMKPTALLYMTIEEIDQSEIDRAFEELRSNLTPAVRGEVVEGDVASYHYYPPRDLVEQWMTDERLEVVEERLKPEEGGWSYRHLLLRSG